jgi:HAD superfamily hydrolase (TIGR01509 family)
MTKIKAVIFDMDGVLIDAKDWHYEALNRALNHFGYNISRYDHLVTFDGLPTRKKLEMLTREHGLPPSLHGFLNELKQLYTTELIHARCKPIFQHEYALSNLKAAGFKIAVASNSIRASIELMMQKSNLHSYLDAIVSNQDVKVGKPDPEIYLKAMSLLGVAPAEALILEDNEHGIASARAAGAHLMMVEEVTDVTLDNINRHITLAEVTT